MLAQEIAIDAGSANTLVVIRKRGIVHHEPSVVALNRKTRAVMAIGSKASEMVGKAPGHIVAVHPMRGGVVSDLEGARALFRFCLRYTARDRVLRPTVLLNMPVGANSVQRKALCDLAWEAGAGEVHLLDESIAAALGAGLPVTSPVGTLLVNVGAGRSSVAVISLGAPVVAQVTDVAGYAMDVAIARHLRHAHNLLIGESTAERIKLGLSAAQESSVLTVPGRHLATGLPTQATVTPAELLDVLSDSFGRLELAIRQVLERTPPELLADIATRGMVLTGGGALTHGLAERLERATGLSAHIAADPDRAAAAGAKRVLEQRFKQSLTVRATR